MASKTILHVVSHTHWDREWYEPFEAYRFQLVKVVDRLLEVLDDDPAFRHFNFDGQTAAIEDYLDVRPPVGPEVERFVREGRLAIGPWRILMDEFLCSPETIIRNLQQGMTRADAMGGSMRVGYIPDSFGHVAQMPQILRLAGISEACVWRGVPFAVDRTAFTWEAPDGSAVRTVYLATSYSNGASLPETFEELVVRAKRIAEDLERFKPGHVLLVMNGTDHHGPQAHLPALFAEANRRQNEFEFRLGSVAEYLRDAPVEDLPHWKGELRSGARSNLLMGVASARIPLKQAEFRASMMLERYAEPLSALAGTDTGRLLDRAWRGMVENSAHDSINGCGIDVVAEQVHARYVEAARVAELVCLDAVETLAGRADTSLIPEGAEGVFLFNPTPRARAGTHEIMLSVDDPENASFVDAHGNVLAAQQIGEPTRQLIVDMTIKGSELARIVPTIHSRMIGPLTVNRLDVEPGRTTTVRLHLGAVAEGHFDVEAAKRRVEELVQKRPRARFRVVAEGPPLCTMLVETHPVEAIGWTVLAPRAGKAAPRDPVITEGRTLRNAALEVVVADDGSATIVHRATGARFERALALVDDGDAGDEYNFSPPQRQSLVDTPDAVQIEATSSGPLEGVIRVHRRYRIPASLAEGGRSRHRRTVPLETTTTLRLRSGETVLRATIDLVNHATDHRLRVAVPLPFHATASHAESAFGAIERGLEAESGSHEFPLPTFPCRRWVDAGDGRTGIAVLHRGTPEFELAKDVLSITLLRCVGWLSRQGMLYRAGPAGPPLEVPGAQLMGPHRFELGLYPHAGDWDSADVYGAAEEFSSEFGSTVTRAHPGSIASSGLGLALEPKGVQLSALVAHDGVVDVRVYNAINDRVDAALNVGPVLPHTFAHVVDLLGNVVGECQRESEETFVVPLRAWEIATIRLG